MGQSGMDLGYGVGSMPGGPLLGSGPRINPITYDKPGLIRPAPVMGSLSRAYDQTLLSQRKMLSVYRGSNYLPNNYLQWSPSDGVAVSGSDPSSAVQQVVAAAPRGSEETPPTTRTLEDLITDHVTAMRRSYVDRGWQLFQAGDYLAALRVFSLAENASLDATQERATIKLAIAYTAVAAGQFAQAAQCIDWLTRDASGGRAGHPEAFNRLFEQIVRYVPKPIGSGAESSLPTIGDLYGTQRAEYVTYNQVVDSAAVRNPESASSQALFALVEWGRGNTDNAIFAARKINDPTGKFTRLAAVLQQAKYDREHLSALAVPEPVPDLPVEPNEGESVPQP